MSDMPEFVDIHSHLNFPDFDKDRDEAVSRLVSAKTWTITVGTDLETSKSAVDLATSKAGIETGIFATIGLHPNDHSNDHSSEDADENFGEKTEGFFSELLKEPRVVAIGECGLDYFRVKPEEKVSAAKKQKEIFEKQINLALKHDKPLMIHCRSAYDDVIEILSSYKRTHGEKLRGDIHFFAGNVEIARKFLEIGFALSFTGVLTFARDYDEVVRFAPLDMIMSETDAPFVSPVPYRGKRNEPSYVGEIVKAMAEIRKEPLEKVKKALVSNAFRVFKL